MSRKSCLMRLFKTTMWYKLFIAVIFSLFLGQPVLTYAGVVIGGTRVVYLSNNSDKSISVFSKEEKSLISYRHGWILLIKMIKTKRHLRLFLRFRG